MSDIGFIAPDRSVEALFQVAPVHNALATMCMFNQHHLSGISDWIDRTATTMPDDLRGRTELACRATAYVGAGTEQFPDWLDSLSKRDAEELVTIDLHNLLNKAERVLGERPDREALQADASLYRSVRERLFAAHETEADAEEIDRGFAALRDPEAYKRDLVALLTRMWTEYVRDEWGRIRPMIEDSVHAFQSVSVNTTSGEAAVKQITQRESLPEDFQKELLTADRIIFIPSVHIGPYMMSLPRQGDTLRFIVTARIPEGSTVRSRRLERSELLTRLSALSDETRMQILEMAAERGAVTATDVQLELGLTQSSASRHLTQLAATGLLAKDASQKTKVYRLGSKRLDEVLASLRGMLDPAHFQHGGTQ